MKFEPGKLDVLTVLLIFVPVPFIVSFMGLPQVAVFTASCLGIIPLAGFMGKATEHLSEHVGPGKGALLNAFFGNACEFILALSALNAGLIDVVKASITGSIMGNVLLVMGMSMFAGGLRHETQSFNRTAVSASATLLALAAIGLLMPAVMLHATSLHTGSPHASELRGQHPSLAISVILSAVYIASLIFSLKTHKRFYGAPVGDEGQVALGVHGWSKKKSISILLAATITVAILAQLLVGAVEQTGKALGMSELFVGVILVAIVGNAAENSSAVLMAIKNRMDLSINIALGSSTQLALLIAPLLVFIGFFLGRPMDLIFTEGEIVAVIIAVVALKFVATDGESNWLEGLMLLGVYAILAVAFYYM